MYYCTIQKVENAQTINNFKLKLIHLENPTSWIPSIYIHSYFDFTLVNLNRKEIQIIQANAIMALVRTSNVIVSIIYSY